MPNSRATCRSGQARWATRSAKPSAWARSWRWRCWLSTTAKPSLRVRRWGEGAGGGVTHARGLPGATPLREIPSHEVTCGDGSVGGWRASTRMGNAGWNLRTRYRIDECFEMMFGLVADAWSACADPVIRRLPEVLHVTLGWAAADRPNE